ncbi:MAG: hypothetical protein COV91_01170 [Candidatus Taylorbacteria bacterium CG11_big_fil_rev_8_21_14_0_20_46_11]|uniref:UPF0102 protein COV91_01170 n=1 Tax=Candidatus Taylorbacteria bacterium CG11_big_fil_rev_8_21_14_0_20_46_11 TaxID=1975025 RepID=A0A2H0KCJ7_9BACT|nr:MAG: hypothetical protein COV91_01170 [Candidatus Taylorbacteria bacterium CG11_big_fil_rev_8_21_14_0_20_46_11]
MGKTQKIGSLGEKIAEKFLVKRGYRILHRNYSRPWGELDIVAKKKGTVHFVEVKTVSDNSTCVSDETSGVDTFGSKGSSQKQSQICNESLNRGRGNVTHETSREKASLYVQSGVRKDRFRPEDNVDKRKIQRLRRVIQTYLSAEHVSDETNWQFDVVTVLVDQEGRRAKVKVLEDVGL